MPNGEAIFASCLYSMKRITPLFLALAIAPVAHAAPAPKVSKAQIEAAAIALLDKAIAAYQSRQGVTMKFQSTLKLGKNTQKRSGMLQWKAPNLLRVEQREDKNRFLMISDGQALFLSLDPRSFRRFPLAAETPNFVARMTASAGYGLGAITAPLLLGKNPLPETRKAAANTPNASYRAQRLAVAKVNGVPSAGLRLTARLIQDGRPMMIETTAWFDAKTPLLRRVQTVTQLPDARSVSVDNISQTNFKPALKPAVFAWSPPPGAQQEASDEAPFPYDPKLQIGAAPPAIAGTSLDGKPRSLASYRGRVVLLDFWATWCDPCIAELPNVKRNYAKYHAKGFDILGISLDEDKETLINFVEKRDVMWPQLFDGKAWKGANAARYGVTAIPFTLLIGRDGKIAAVNPRGSQLEIAIRKALK